MTSMNSIPVENRLFRSFGRGTHHKDVKIFFVLFIHIAILNTLIRLFVRWINAILIMIIFQIIHLNSVCNWSNSQQNPIESKHRTNVHSYGRFHTLSQPPSLSLLRHATGVGVSRSAVHYHLSVNTVPE